MKAVTVQPGVANSVRFEEVPDPDASTGSILVDAVAVGICGTDVDINSGGYGWAPPGRERIILGHESLGRVVDPGPEKGLKAGDLIVGIVRRPDPVPCPNCAVGLLAAMIGVQYGFDTHVLDRVTEGPKPQLVRDLGATYHSGAVTDVGFAPVEGNGGWLLGAGRGFVHLAPDGTHRMVAEVSPSGTRMNDGACDPQGRFWAGTLADDHHEGGGALYRLESPRAVRSAGRV